MKIYIYFACHNMSHVNNSVIRVGSFECVCLREFEIFEHLKSKFRKYYVNI